MTGVVSAAGEGPTVASATSGNIFTDEALSAYFDTAP